MKDLLYVAMLLLAGVRPCGAQVAALVYDPKQDLNASLQIAEGVEVLANQLLELLPLDVVEIVSTISDDMTILNTIIQEGSQVGMDLQSLQVQITSLFDLSTAPATSSELMDLVFLFIEFYIAALMALLLVPWQIYGSSAFLAEFGIGWVLGATLRVVVLGAILSLFYPLLAVLMPLTAPGAIGPDPTYFQIVLIVVTTVIFSIVTWFVPARTAGLVARGLSLSGHVVLAAASTGARGMLLTQSVIRGTSQMLKTRTA